MGETRLYHVYAFFHKSRDPYFNKEFFGLVGSYHTEEEAIKLRDRLMFNDNRICRIVKTFNPPLEIKQSEIDNWT